MTIEAAIERYRHLASILRDSAIGWEVELRTRGICPDCLMYLDEYDRCACERELLRLLNKTKRPKLHLVETHSPEANQKLKTAKGGRR